MPKVSVIVPIYKVEKWLPKCIDSILSQTLRDLELILIDDGSPDRCPAICDEYAEQDSRVVVIHQENAGVSAARNAGLDVATGEYIGYVDPDDWIAPEMYQTMVDAIESSGAQLACCQWIDAYEDGGCRKRDISSALVGTMTAKEFVRHMFDIPRTVGGSNLNKLFCREKLSQRYDTSIAIAEDNLFLTEYCMQISYVVCIPNVMYYVLQRDGSATRGDPNRFAEESKTRERIANLLRNYDRKIANLAEDEFMQSCLRVMRNSNMRLTMETREENRKRLRKYMKNHMLHILRNSEIGFHTKVLFFLILLGVCN